MRPVGPSQSQQVEAGQVVRGRLGVTEAGVDGGEVSSEDDLSVAVPGSAVTAAAATAAVTTAAAAAACTRTTVIARHRQHGTVNTPDTAPHGV